MAAIDSEAVGPRALREVAYEITAELICCSGDDPAQYEHAICRYAGFARELVLEKAHDLEGALGKTWIHTRDKTVCESGPISHRTPPCTDHGMEVRLAPLEEAVPADQAIPSPAQVQAARLMVAGNNKLGQFSSPELKAVAEGRNPRAN